MNVSRMVLGTLAVLLMAGSLRAATDNSPRVSLPGSIEATPDADPSRRHVEVVKVPGRLVVEHRNNGALIYGDSTSLREVKLSVGYKMTVGVEDRLYYFKGGTRVDVCHGWTGSVNNLARPGGASLSDLMSIAEEQGAVQIVDEYTIFETDLPPQHDWVPEQGKFRVLWRGLAVGTYDLQ